MRFLPRRGHLLPPADSPPVYELTFICDSAGVCKNLLMADDRVGDKLFEVEGEAVSPPTAPGRVNKRFRHYDQSQSFLLPPSLDDWLPENHEARFISEVVENMLDLDCIYDSYTEASGAPPYDPAMMLKL